MPFAKIDDVQLYYEIVGEAGPWVVLSQGGRRNLSELQELARIVGHGGCRVLLHDRRNTGQSGLLLDGSRSEFAVWADDAELLMQQVGVTSALLAGSSSGCRMSILLTLRHPTVVRGLFVMRPTGGTFAVRRLSRRYYTVYIDAAERGGMEEVCATDHFRDLIALDPSRAEVLRAMDSTDFVRIMNAWRDSLEEGLSTPILGASEIELRTFHYPTCIVPGNDNTHSRETGLLMQSLMPDAELHELAPEHQDVDIVPMERWVDQAILGRLLLDFAHRRVFN